jgi:hypothetical protein
MRGTFQNKNCPPPIGGQVISFQNVLAIYGRTYTLLEVSSKYIEFFLPTLYV